MIKKQGLEKIKSDITFYYQKTKRTQLRLSSRQIETPTQDTEKEIIEMTGFMKGLKKSLDFVEIEMNSNELPL